jgi:hypothetical protein
MRVADKISTNRAKEGGDLGWQIAAWFNLKSNIYNLQSKNPASVAGERGFLLTAGLQTLLQALTYPSRKSELAG